MTPRLLSYLCGEPWTFCVMNRLISSTSYILNVAPIPTELEDLFKEQVSRIEVMRKDKNAAVDLMGCHMLADPLAEPPTYRFQVLLSLLLSSQTKDEITSAAIMRLRAHGCTVDTMLEISTEELEKLLYPKKAVYIQKVASILKERYNRDVPENYEDLCALPGIGPKMSHLILQVAWGRVEGIAVDTHVHRIVNRLGWMKTATPETTRAKLESMLPRADWGTINPLLVGFGQQICLPVKPMCDQCLCQDICPSSTKKQNKIVNAVGGSGSYEEITKNVPVKKRIRKSGQ